jgi:hypothetical protein
MSRTMMNARRTPVKDEAPVYTCRSNAARDILIATVERARSADQAALLLVANNNGTASQAAWDRIVADPAYKKLEANLASSEAVLKAAKEAPVA